MRTLGLDADAFMFLRKLGLLEDLVALASPPEPKISLHTTGYVARFELNDLSAVLESMVRASTLKISPVKTRTPTAGALAAGHPLEPGCGDTS